jgi:hypothetical protein
MTDADTISTALGRIRAMQRRRGCENGECRSRTAMVYWGDGCSDCRPNLDLSEQHVANATDLAVRRWKDGQR